MFVLPIVATIMLCAIPVHAAFGYEDTFDALTSASGIDMAVIDDRSYAVVVGTAGSIQIIDISDPHHPLPASSVFDDTGGFDTLGGAVDVKIVSTDNGVYAAVTSYNEPDGIQIVNITDPFNPGPVSSVRDGSGGFDTLGNPYGVDIATINGRIYAVVGSGWPDHGVQIIDMTDPLNPGPVSSVRDGSGGFEALGGANDVDILMIHDQTFAVVASEHDGVQIMDITNPFNPTPVASIVDNTGGFNDMYGSIDVETVMMQDRAYVVVAVGDDDENRPDISDNSVHIIDITEPGTPILTASIHDGTRGFEALNRPFSIGIMTTEDATYAVVAAQRDNAVQIINITDPFNPVPVSSAFDGIGGFEALGGANDVKIATIHGRTYAMVSSGADDGVQVIDITNPAHPKPVVAIFNEKTTDVKLLHAFYYESEGVLLVQFDNALILKQNIDMIKADSRTLPLLYTSYTTTPTQTLYWYQLDESTQSRIEGSEKMQLLLHTDANNGAGVYKVQIYNITILR